jgi:hypothetical protein
MRVAGAAGERGGSDSERGGLPAAVARSIRGERFALMEPETLSPMARYARVARIVLFLCATVLVFGRTLSHAFVWDDEYFIVSNTSIRSLANVPSFFTDKATIAGRDRAEDLPLFRPLRNVLFALNYRIAGLDPAWWHAVSIALHALAAFVLWRLAQRLTGRPWAGWVAGMAFLVHPVQTEVVAWAKCQDDILSVLLVLAAMHFWIRQAGRWTLRPAAAVCGLYLAACLAKEQAIVLPVLLLGYDAWTGTGTCEGRGSLASCFRVLATRHAALVGALAATGIGFLGWRHAFIGRTSQTDYLAGSFGATMVTMVDVPLRYLQLLLAPVNLRADYSDMPVRTSLLEPHTFLSLVVIAALAGGLFALRRRLPLATYGFVFIFVALLPMSNVVPMMQYMAERFLYLPMIGFALAAGDVVRRAETKHGRAACVLAGAVLAAWSVMSFQRLAVWKDGTTLYRATVEDTTPAAIRPRRNLLRTLVQQGYSDEAFALAKELYDRYTTRMDIPPVQRAEYARHLGYLHYLRGQQEEGLRLLDEAMAADPSFALPYVDRGVFAGVRNRHEEALAWFDKAVAADPGDEKAHYNRGIALQSMERNSEAEAAFREAFRLAPDQPDALREYAALVWNDGRHAEAAALFAEGARAWPRDPFFKEWYKISTERLKALPQPGETP